jgi:putative flippase GtrA
MIERLLSKQIIRFVFFSGIAAFANISSGFLFYNIFNWPFFYSIVFSYLIGLFISFSLNRKFTFPNRIRKINSEFFTFLIISLIGLCFLIFCSKMIINLLSYWNFNDYIKKVAAHLGSVLFVSFYSFIFHKHVTFSKGFIFLFKNILKKNIID